MTAEIKDIVEVKLYIKSSVTLAVQMNDISENSLKITCLPKQYATIKTWLRKEKSCKFLLYYQNVCGECSLGKYENSSGEIICTFKKGMISTIKRFLKNSTCKIVFNMANISYTDGTSKYAFTLTFQSDPATNTKQPASSKTKNNTTSNRKNMTNGKKKAVDKKSQITGQKNKVTQKEKTKTPPSRYPPSLYPPKGMKPFSIQIVKGGVSHVQSNGSVLTTKEVQEKSKERAIGGNSTFLIDVKEKPKQKYHSSSRSPKSKSGANKNRPKNFGGEKLSLDRYSP